jgi:polar amino acid transport system substrate-binding protein
MTLFRTMICSLLIIILLPLAQAHAYCSRVMNVPVAAIGLSVIDTGNLITGVYPELLAMLSNKEKCQFRLTIVPRSRLEFLFENGQADIMLPSTRTPRRDQSGIFVPMIRNRATLISVESSRAPVRSFQELIDRSGTKLAIVRGFDYGEAYQQLLVTLQKQGRLITEAEPVSVARLLKSGAADYTLMVSSILAGAIETDSRVEDLSGKLRFEVLAELPWGESGMYISRKTLSEEDRTALQEMFERLSRSGLVWKSFQRYYKKDVLTESLRPFEPGR